MATLFSFKLPLDSWYRTAARATASCRIILLGLLTAAVSPAHGSLILFSTSGSAELGSLSFESDDLVLFDPVTNAASIFFDGSLFKRDEDINAVSVLANGNLLLSTQNEAKLGEFEFDDGDIVEYNPLTGTASLYFSEDQFSGDEEINALTVLDNGNLVFSTRKSATLGGLDFENEDLVEYDPATGQTSLFFDGGLFEENEDIDAVQVLNNGNIALSTRKKATLGGLTFGDDVIVEYDPIANSSSVLLDGSSLFNDLYEDINALFIFEDFDPVDRIALASSFGPLQASVPEPGTSALLGASILLLILMRQKYRCVYLSPLAVGWRRESPIS